MVTERIKKEWVNDLSNTPFKTTLADLVKIGPTFVERGTGKRVTERISSKLEENDLKYILFYFCEEMWLIDNDFFNAAILSMVTMVENCLRNECYSRVKTEKLSKEEIEGVLGLGGLRKKLKQYLSRDANEALIKLNKLRSLFIHKNMEEGKKRVLANKLIECPECHLGGGSILTRETTRTLINFSADSFAEEVFWLALLIVKELYPCLGKNIDGLNFDSIVQHALNPESGWKIYGDEKSR